MNVAFFEVEDWQRDFFKSKLKKDKLFFSSKALSSGDLKKIKDVDVLCVFVKSQVSKGVVDKLANLKLVVTMSTGYDHVDVKYCSKKGIKVSNVPNYGMNTVAQHTFALLLNLSKKIEPSLKQSKKAFVDRSVTRGFDLAGKTLGIIWTGNIGQEVIKMACGFSMKIIAFDVFKNMKAAKKLGYKYVSLDTLFKKSDVITLHVPLFKSTRHILNNAAFKKMKRGVVLINTARGALIDTKVLIGSLKKGKLGGVGLDVLEDESIFSPKKLLGRKVSSENKFLLHHPNVLVTNHNAFNTIEAIERIMKCTVSNIKGNIGKGKGVNLVK